MYRIIVLLLFTSLWGIDYVKYVEFDFPSDYEFTNQNYTINNIKSFLKKFPKNKLTDEQVWFGYYQCRAYSIHPLIWFSTMEKEVGIVSCITNEWKDYRKYKWREHRCMGYGLINSTRIKGKKYYKYGFYEVQVHQGIKGYRKLFKEADLFLNEPETIFPIDDGMEFVLVTDRAEYALVRYTPHRKGCEDFIKIYRGFKAIWETIQ